MKINLSQEHKKIILNCTDSIGRLNQNLYRKNVPEIDFLLEYYSFKELYHLVKDNLEKFPVCLICGKELRKFWRNKSNYCSRKCASVSDSTKKKRKKSVLKKYGVENISQSIDVKRKKIETCLENNGCEFPQQNKVILKKSIETLKSHYGVERPSQNKEIQDRIKQTNLEKYGTESPLQSEEIKEKIRDTNLEKYGVICSLKNESVKKKARESCRKKYGCEFPSQNKETLIKIRKGLKSFNWEKFKKSMKKNKLEILFDKEEYLNEKVPLRFRCKICGNTFSTENDRCRTVKCPECKREFFSLKEKELVSFIKSIYNGIVIENDRSILTNKELDIYIPEKKLAIEFNGTYWHSDIHKDMFYHQKKSIDCFDKDIQLIHIYEYEWDNSRTKIENLLKTCFGVYEKEIDIEETIINEISLSDYIVFLNENQLEEPVFSPIRYGLFYKNELVAVIGIEQKNDISQINDYCIKLGYKIPNVLRKILLLINNNSFSVSIDLSHPITRDEFIEYGFVHDYFSIPKCKLIKGNSIVISDCKDILKQNQKKFIKIYDAGKAIFVYS